MFTVIVYDLTTNLITEQWVNQLEADAVEMASYAERNPYVIAWHHDMPWDYVVYLTDGSKDIDHWDHPHWGN